MKDSGADQVSRGFGIGRTGLAMPPEGLLCAKPLDLGVSRLVA